VREQRPVKVQPKAQSLPPTKAATVGAIVLLQVLIAVFAFSFMMKDFGGNSTKMTVGSPLPPPGTIDPQLVDDSYVQAYLHSCGQTDRLLLSNSHITSGLMGDISKHKELEVLYLDDTDIDDSSLAKLTALPKLWYLDLDYTKVTDGCVEHLVKLHTVSSLHLKGTRISKTAISKIQTALPECEIEHNAR